MHLLWLPRCQALLLHASEMTLRSLCIVIIGGENRNSRTHILPITNLSTTNPTLTALGLNKGPRREKLTNNSLKYGTAVISVLRILFNPEDGGSSLLRNIGKLPDCTAPHPRR
jgi:hypothetical protein